MNRYRHDTRLIHKGVFNAVTVMCIQIHVQDPGSILIQQRQDRKHRIIEIAEAAGPVRAAMVGAARRMKGYMTLTGKLCRHYRAANRHCRALEKARKQRVFKGTYVELRPDFRSNDACGICVLERLDIGAIMKSEQLLRSCRLDGPKLLLRKPSEDSDQVKHRSVVHDLQRMIPAKRGLAKDIAAKVQRGRRFGAADRQRFRMQFVHACATIH